MERIYNPYLSNSLFFKPEQMYGDNRKVFESLDHIVHGKLYFLAERRKVRVDPRSIVLSEDGKITFVLILDDGQRRSFCFPFAPTIINLGHLFKKYYGNAETLQRYVIGVRDHDEYLSRYRQRKPSLIGVSLNPGAQSSRNIALKIHTPDERVEDFTLSIHGILSEFQFELGDFPKIIYIGKSENLQDRIYRHEHIQEALATVGDDHDMYLYAFQFDASVITLGESPGMMSMIHRDHVRDISADQQLALVEMALINYFKPRLNTHYKRVEIASNEKFNEALGGKYSQIVLEVDNDGDFWNFGSDFVSAAQRHQIEYSVHARL